MNITFKLFLLPLAILVLLVSTTHATANNKTRAQTLFDDGKREYDSENWIQAVTDLKESYRLFAFSYTAYFLSCSYTASWNYIEAEKYAKKANSGNPILPGDYKQNLSKIIKWTNDSKKIVTVESSVEISAKADNPSRRLPPPKIFTRRGKIKFPQDKPNSEKKTFDKKRLKISKNKSQKIFINRILQNRPQRNLTFDDVTAMFVKKGFYDVYKNKRGNGFANKFTKPNYVYVIDHASNLIWQQSGSDGAVNYKDAKAYISRLNIENFAGFSGWRLPTLEEAMTLMEPKAVRKLRIDSLFDWKQRRIWTSDQRDRSNNWYVDFVGSAGTYNKDKKQAHVRAVRDYQTEKTKLPVSTKQTVRSHRTK